MRLDKGWGRIDLILSVTDYMLWFVLVRIFLSLWWCKLRLLARRWKLQTLWIKQYQSIYLKKAFKLTFVASILLIRFGFYTGTLNSLSLHCHWLLKYNTIHHNTIKLNLIVLKIFTVYIWNVWYVSPYSYFIRFSRFYYLR